PETEEEESSLVGLSSFLEAEIDQEEDEPEDTSTPNDNLFLYSQEGEKQDRLSSNSSPMLILLVVIILLAIFGALFYRVFNQSRTNELQLSLGQSLIELPEELAVDNQSIPETLSANTALEVVNGWLDAKALATGPDYNLGALENVLADPFLSIWRSNVNNLRSQNAYRRYEHGVTIEEVNLNPQNNLEANVTARVRENSQYFNNGQLNSQQSYDSNLLVRYDLIKINNRWLIRNSQIIP
ncbi:ARC6/PARC6 family protein, partial [Cyanobacterium stanieri LEGE 03274]